MKAPDTLLNGPRPPPADRALVTAPEGGAPVGLRQLHQLSGPRRWPLVGSALYTSLRSLHQSLERWAQQFGDLFVVQLGRRRLLVVADPQLVAKVLRERPTQYRRTQVLERVMRELGFAGVFSAEGDDWRRQRRLVMAAFDARHLRAYFPHLERVLGRYRHHLLQAAQSARPVRLSEDLMRYTVDNVAGLAFGTDLNTTEAGEDRIQAALGRIFPMLFRRITAVVPWWRFVRTPADHALARDLQQVNRAVDALIAGARLRLTQSPQRALQPDNLLDAMLVAAQAPDQQLDDATLRANLVIMLLAGEDTTAYTLAWLLHELARRPDIFARLRAEADAVLGDALQVTAIEQLARLPYTEACLHEIMRMRPVAPMMIAQSLHDGVLGDVQVPAGTEVLLLFRPGGHDEARFAQPTRFRPERWLDGSGQVNSRDERITMPFGAGPRLCPGRGLALMEMVMLVSMLVRNFDIVALESADGCPVEEWLHFVMQPSPLRMELAVRTAGGALPRVSGAAI